MIKKILSLRGLIALFLSISVSGPVFAIDKNTFSNFSIAHADKLNFKDKGSELIGNVRIQFGEFTLASPRVLVDTSAVDTSPERIRFVEGVRMTSKELTMDAKEIEIDLNEGLFKAVGDPEVLSVWGKGKDRTEIISLYQEYNLKTGLVKATNKGAPEQITVTSPRRTIVADEVELQNILDKKKRKKDKIESINFTGDVILVEKDKRIEANNLFYWLVGETIKAEDNVKLLSYTKEKDPIYIFSDLITLEVDKDIFSASMNGFDRSVHLYSKQFMGRARNAVVKRINKQPDQAVLTGDAFAQFKDKAINGQEILFDIKNKTLRSLVGRPTTSVYSLSKKQKKANKKADKKAAKKAESQKKLVDNF